MAIKKTIGNLLATLAVITMLAGTSNVYAMQKRKARCASESSQLGGDAVPAQTYKPLESERPEQQKRKLKTDNPEELDSEQPENSEQDPMDSVYINNPSMAQQMEDAELFANNGAILNAEFEEIFALVAQERMQARVQAQQQKRAYQQFLARQAPIQQRQVRAMRPQTFACANCTYINAAHLLACSVCGQAR